MHHTPEKKPSDLRDLCLPFWRIFPTHVLVPFQLFTLKGCSSLAADNVPIQSGHSHLQLLRARMHIPAG